MTEEQRNKVVTLMQWHNFECTKADILAKRAPTGRLAQSYSNVRDHHRNAADLLFELLEAK